MSLVWINPIYFAGLVLLVLPILLHLVQKQDPRGFKFPSLMFLRQIPRRRKSRLEVRDWLLLLLRCLLLTLLVLAFARPYFNDPNSTASLLERRDSVLLLDRSYSMHLGQRWQQAQTQALALVEQRAAGERIGLVWFDDAAEVASDLSDDDTNLKRLIDSREPGMRTTRLRLAIEQAARVLDASQAGDKRIVVISDFAAASEIAPRIAADIDVITLPVSTAAADNAAIAGYTIGPGSSGASDQFTLEVDVVNHGPRPVTQRLNLSLNGRTIESRPIPLAAGENKRLTFAELKVAGALARGRLSLEEDALTIDNQAYFVFSNRQRVPVLLIANAEARANQLIYLERALELSRQPAYRVRRAAWINLRADDLLQYAVIVVNDAALPGGAIGQALRRFVAAGGGLLVATGDQPQGNWPSSEAGFVPGRLLRQVEASPGNAFRLVRPVAPLEAAALGRARIFSYRELEPQAGERVLARYHQGAVALLERRLGSGKSVVLTTTLDTHWNDLALKPNFLPFIHRLMAYLSAYQAYPSSLLIGDAIDVMDYARALAGGDALVSAANDAPLTIEVPQGAELRLPREDALLEIEQSGFYQAHRATPAEVDVVIAANIDAQESLPHRLDVDRYVEDIRASAAIPTNGKPITERAAHAIERQQALWYVVLSLALVLILFEAFVANWITGRRASGN